MSDGLFIFWYDWVVWHFAGSWKNVGEYVERSTTEFFFVKIQLLRALIAIKKLLKIGQPSSGFHGGQWKIDPPRNVRSIERCRISRVSGSYLFPAEYDRENSSFKNYSQRLPRWEEPIFLSSSCSREVLVAWNQGPFLSYHQSFLSVSSSSISSLLLLAASLFWEFEAAKGRKLIIVRVWQCAQIVLVHWMKSEPENTKFKNAFQFW